MHSIKFNARALQACMGAPSLTPCSLCFFPDLPRTLKWKALNAYAIIAVLASGVSGCLRSSEMLLCTDPCLHIYDLVLKQRFACVSLLKRCGKHMNVLCFTVWRS